MRSPSSTGTSVALSPQVFFLGRDISVQLVEELNAYPSVSNCRSWRKLHEERFGRSTFALCSCGFLQAYHPKRQIHPWCWNKLLHSLGHLVSMSDMWLKCLGSSAKARARGAKAFVISERASRYFVSFTSCCFGSVKIRSECH